MVDWATAIVGAVSTAVPIMLYMFANRRAAKREAEEKYEKAKEESDAKHEENKRILEDILMEKLFFPPHVHSERQGSLSAEGIRQLPYNEKRGRDR